MTLDGVQTEHGIDLLYEFEDNNQEYTQHIDCTYPRIIEKLTLYIDKIKKSYDGSLVEIITNFAYENDIDVRLVGDAIYDDEMFKSFIKKDCEVRGLMQSKYTIQEDW